MAEKRQILNLEELSSKLEPSRQEREVWQKAADDVINEFIDQLLTRKTYSAFEANLIPEFKEKIESFSSKSDSLLPILETLETDMAHNGILTAGPGHMGFIPGGGIYIGAIADHLASAINSFSADAYASPIAVHIHEEVVRWLADMIGYDEKSWGDITSGGSQATLTAFYTAREAFKIKSRDYEKICVYLSTHTHHCSEKALRVLFGDDVCLRKVPLKDQVMDIDELRQLILQDRAQGLIPWLIIGTAGSTNLGRVDPLAGLAQVAKEFSLWLHIDAAYGGFFKLCGESSELFKGLERANSVVLDPHKGMFLPYGCGAVMIKNGEFLHKSVNETATYLQDCKEEKQKSPMNYSLELSRPFRSLRIWLALKIYGKNTFKNALSEKLLLAKYCYEQLERIPYLKMVGKLDLSILGFRYEHPSNPSRGNDETRCLLKAINDYGDVFLSSTMIDGYFVIRVAILSFRTHLKTIEKLIEIVKSEIGKKSSIL